MSVAFQGTPTTASATAGAPSTLTLNVPAGVVSGEILLALVMDWGFGTPDPNTPSGWTLLQTGGTVPDYHRYYTYWRVATGSEPANYTWTGFHNYEPAFGAMLRFSGAASPPTGSNVIFAAASGNSTVCDAVTVAAADSMIVWWGSKGNVGSTQTISRGGAMKRVDAYSGIPSFVVWTEPVSATVNPGATITQTNSPHRMGCSILLAPAATGKPPGLQSGGNLAAAGIYSGSRL